MEICRETNRKSDRFYCLTQRDVGPVPGGTSGASRTIATHPDVDLELQPQSDRSDIKCEICSITREGRKNKMVTSVQQRGRSHPDNKSCDWSVWAV